MLFIPLGPGKARQLFLLKEAEQVSLMVEANLLLTSTNGRNSKEEARSAPDLVVGVRNHQESEQKTA